MVLSNELCVLQLLFGSFPCVDTVSDKTMHTNMGNTDV